jgi:cell wall-associated NlpC family hydrolase
LVTQILFGELYRITGREGSWYSITLVFDNYEGWIDASQVHGISEKEFVHLEHAPTPVTLDLVQLVSDEKGKSLIPVLTGSSLPGFDGEGITIADNRYHFEGQVSPSFHRSDNSRDLQAVSSQLTQDALLYLNAPYLWGGRSPFGLDCSGFVQMVFKLQGISLLRDAFQQATQGEMIPLLEEARSGDLAFFDNEEGAIVHVGILLDPRRIIHCSGQVRIDAIDHEGIFHTQLGRYSHKLRLIRRLI